VKEIVSGSDAINPTGAIAACPLRQPSASPSP
jgi:hypothetical protein